MSSLLPSNIYGGLCDFPDPVYLFFSENVPPIVYYSHLPIAVIALALGIFVLLKNRRGLPNQALFVLTLSYSLWVLLDSVFWASNRGDVVMFVWSLQILFEPLIYMSALYIMYTLIRGRDMPFFGKTIIALLYTPVVLFVPTKLMLYAFDEASCLSLEGPLATYYTYGMEALLLVWIIIFASREAWRQAQRRAEIFILTFGISCLLLMFSIGNIISSFTGDWGYAQVGLFTMPIFVGFFVYSIVKYNTFKIQLISTAALVFALGGLNFSFLFIAQSTITRTVAVLTLFLTIIFGVFIIRNVKREIEQREEIERLAENLRTANKRLKVLDRMKSEFVSIASHQLRSPLTSIRGYTSMILEGTYGKLSPKLNEVVENINDSAKYMAMSVEDYLNVSRIESGNMKYELSTFDLRVQAEKIVDEMRNLAMKRGLVMIFRSDCDSGCKIRADIGKTRQIIMNILDNSIKYTEKGTITVIAHDDVAKQKMYVTVHDTGVGMDKTALEEVFDKFVRAKNANCVNVNGSGLGLYVAKKMVTDMGGRVWAESEGEGKGSIFHIEFPLAND